MKRREIGRILSVKPTDALREVMAKIARNEGRPIFRQVEFFLEIAMLVDQQEKAFRLRPEKPDFGNPSGESWKPILAREDFAYLEKCARESGISLSSQAREWLWAGIEGYDDIAVEGRSYRKEEFARRLIERRVIMV